MLRLLLAALVFLNSQLAYAQAWPNEPAGSMKLAECDFNGTKDCGVLDGFYGGGALTDMPDAPYSPGGVYYDFWAPGARTGNEFGIALIGPRSMKDIYVAFYWKMNKDFEGYSSGTNKLFFIRDTGNPDSTPGCNTNGVFMIGGYDGIDGRNFPFHLFWSINTGGLDNSNNPTCNDGWSQGALCPPNVSDKDLWPETWYLIEAYVKASSCPTCNDGIIRWWVDGELMGDVTNYNYGCGTMNEFLFDHAWDGANCSSGNPRDRDCTRLWAHYLDHLYISAPDCPNGCPVTGNTGGGSTGGTKVEKGAVCDPITDVEIYVEKDKPAPVGQAIRDALGRN